MSEDLSSLAAKHHAFYEVLPYYEMDDERQGGASVTTRVQTGFEVDIYGLKTKNELAPPGPDSDYAPAYAEVKKIAEEVAHHSGGHCSVEVIPSPSSAFLDAQDHTRVEARIQICISHLGDSGEAAGLPEQRALEELENQLRTRGIRRR